MSGLSARQWIPGKQKVIDRQWKVFRIQKGKNDHKKVKNSYFEVLNVQFDLVSVA